MGNQLINTRNQQSFTTTLNNTLQTSQDEGFSSRCCSGCHSLCFRCAVEGQKVLGWSLEGRLEERSRAEVHGRSVRIHLDLQRGRNPGPGRRQQQQPNRWSCRRQGAL